MHDDKLDQPAFGQSVRRARVKGGLSQESLAAKLGLDQATLSRIERGKISVTKSSTDLRAFLNQRAEQRSDIDRIASAIGESPELKALIARVLSESDA